jgi:hypothetical protein
MFENILRKAAADANVELRQVEVRQQAPDPSCFMECSRNFLSEVLYFPSSVKCRYWTSTSSSDR